MTVNKVVYGGATLIDLTNDTVTEDVIIEGYVGHNASGKQVTGKLKIITVDDALSTDSTNPVQNKVITEALNEVTKSGVYVGGGEMPDGYNVQIDISGDATTGLVTVAEVQAMIDASLGVIENGSY